MAIHRKKFFWPQKSRPAFVQAHSLALGAGKRLREILWVFKVLPLRSLCILRQILAYYEFIKIT